MGWEEKEMVETVGKERENSNMKREKNHPMRWYSP